MGRRRSKKILLEKIEITDAGAKGKGVGKAPDGRVVFVPFTAPGDVVDVRVLKKRKNYYEGKAVQFHQYSPLRREPACAYFGICGGCKWQHVTYEAQLQFKSKEVLENLKRIGHVAWKNEEKILASPVEYAYRNKMEYAFTASKWLTEEEIRSGKAFDRRGLGFHIPGHWDKILDIDDCKLQPEPGNRIRNALRDFAKEENIGFYHPRERKGLLRQLTIRITKLGEVMVLVHFFEEDKPAIEKVMSFLAGKFPEITSLLYVVNPKANDTIYDLPVKLFKGRDYIEEEIAGLRFRIKAKSFFQTNSYQVEQLYAKVKAYADLKKDDLVYDLYSGAGTIALFVAPEVKKVVGVESVPDAVEDARENARINRIENVDFESGDMKEIFNGEFVKKHGKPDVIITDPPRDGMHQKVVEQIKNLLPRRIVYVSCNSATQARDLALLSDRYEVETLQPVDMFPQTYHVENIAVLSLKKDA